MLAGAPVCPPAACAAALDWDRGGAGVGAGSGGQGVARV